MKLPSSLAAQARALRSLTGIPLAHCRRILVLAAAERAKKTVMTRRATISAKQLELHEQPVSEEIITAEFAKLRAMLAEEAA